MTQQSIDSPLMAVSCIRFRRALNLPNNVWLKPARTYEQIAKAKQQALLATRPALEQAQAALQMQLRVEGLPEVEHVSVCV